MTEIIAYAVVADGEELKDYIFARTDFDSLMAHETLEDALYYSNYCKVYKLTIQVEEIEKNESPAS